MNYISTKDMTRAEWLEARRQGIGGSDASAIMGQNQWASPLSVYMDKRGIAPDKEPTEAMIQGTDCEDVVAKRFERETGLKVKRCNKLFSHPEYLWMKANIDRQLVGTDGFVGLECKTTMPYGKTDFEGSSIPPNYFWQCQHYMAVTGAREWYLAVQVWGTAFHIFRIVRDENAMLSRQNNGEWYPPLNRVALSKAENEYVLLIPDHVYAIATFLGCSAHDIYPKLYTEDASG